MFKDYLKSNKKIISENLALDLIKYRQLYDYPKARLIKSTNITDIRISPTIFLTPEISKDEKFSHIDLDKYHNQLLHSNIDSDNLIGTASIIFWGFYTFSEKYSMIRVERHLNGYKGMSGATSEYINRVIANIKHRKSMGDKLSELKSVSQLSRTPFASKVIAFMFPENAGVYDNQIFNGLNRSEWAKDADLITKIGSVDNPAIQNGYTKWCLFLSEVAKKMNESIINGKNWFWNDLNEDPRPWRAIDVERSLFYYFKNREDLT